MFFRQQVKTVTHVVELLNFVQDRIRMHGVSSFPESLTARSAESSLGRPQLEGLSRGKTDLTALPCNTLTDRYAATATLWKVEVMASNV
jgi:hypothetical protein